MKKETKKVLLTLGLQVLVGAVKGWWDRRQTRNKQLEALRVMTRRTREQCGEVMKRLEAVRDRLNVTAVWEGDTITLNDLLRVMVNEVRAGWPVDSFLERMERRAGLSNIGE